MHWSPEDLNRLEEAITEGARIQLLRRGTEYTLIPRTLQPEGGTEILVATHTTTGEDLEFRLDEIDDWAVLY